MRTTLQLNPKIPPGCPRVRSIIMRLSIALVAAVFAASVIAWGQQTPFSPAEQAVEAKIGKLGHNKADPQRGAKVKSIALEIRELPPSNGKVLLANGLANLATEGELSDGALQEVATTLALSLHETPQPDEHGEPAFAYQELAQLERVEHLKVSLKDPSYKAAVVALNKIHAAQAKVDFTLQDITGKSWTLSSLKGKVVVVNFWATWCPPCRQEMPDLEKLSKEYADQGLVVLAISDEPAKTVQPFIQKQGYTFPVLLDAGRKVNDEYHMEGIPHSFVYNRQGHLAAEAIDMRSRSQFLKLLSEAGLNPKPQG
jgi:peroxiredoxin